MAGPPDQLVQAIQESRAILQTSSVLLSQEGDAAAEIEAGDEQDPELWDQDVDEAEGMEGFEETHAPGGPSVDLAQARKTATECKPIMPPQQKRTANRGAGDSGERERPTCAGPAVINESHAEFKGHRIRHAFATSMCAHPGIGKLLRFCLLSFCAVAWFCTRECPGGHWPACYDQTRGFPGEGPMTTLDSPVISGPSLTPTQELQTCVLKRRKTRGIKWESRVCSSCEKVLKPKQNRHTCVVCPAWACSAPL